eukprot:gene2130-23678_t
MSIMRGNSAGVWMKHLEEVSEPTTQPKLPTPGFIMFHSGEGNNKGIGFTLKPADGKIQIHFPPPLTPPPHLNCDCDWGSAARPRAGTHTSLPFSYALPPGWWEGGARDEDATGYGYSCAACPRFRYGVHAGAAKAAPWALCGEVRHLADTVAEQHEQRAHNGDLAAAWSPRGGRPPHPRGPPPPPPG